MSLPPPALLLEGITLMLLDQIWRIATCILIPWEPLTACSKGRSNITPEGRRAWRTWAPWDLEVNLKRFKKSLELNRYTRPLPLQVYHRDQDCWETLLDHQLSRLKRLRAAELPRRQTNEAAYESGLALSVFRFCEPLSWLWQAVLMQLSLSLLPLHVAIIQYSCKQPQYIYWLTTLDFDGVFTLICCLSFIWNGWMFVYDSSGIDSYTTLYEIFIQVYLNFHSS